MELFEYEPITPQILEDDKANGRLVIGGRFQMAETPNANGRIYSRPLWEKILADKKILEALAARRMLGLLEHPADGKTDPTKASHIVTTLSLNENNEIIGRAEILNTPNGLILQELFRAGCQMGISSRGTGTLRKGPQGDFVNEDFALQTFDVVLTPSTPMAYPKPLSESTEIKELDDMTAHDKYIALEQRASTILEADVSNDAGRKLVESAATKLIVELSGTSNEDPSLKEVIAPLIKDLNAKRKSLKQPLKEETVGSADQGFVRTVPQAPPPPPGEGSAINFADAGPLAGYVDHVNPWMAGATEADGAPIHNEAEKETEKPVVAEAEDEGKCGECGKPTQFCKCKKKKKGEDKGEKKEANEDEKNEAMVSFAEQVIALEESEENTPFRALAAAFLLEKENRVNESEAYSRVISKIQEKLVDAEKTGKLVVEAADELLEQKYQVSLHIIEELKNRLKLLSAKVYAEQQLETVGKKNDKEARQVMAEAIKKDASKASIDEAFLSIKTMKALPLVNNVNPNKKAITESVKAVEGVVNTLSESATAGRGMAVGDMVNRLTRNMTTSRSL